MVTSDKPRTLGRLNRGALGQSSALTSGLKQLKALPDARRNYDIPGPIAEAMTIHRASAAVRQQFPSEKAMVAAFIERGLIEAGYTFPAGHEFQDYNLDRAPR